MWLLRIAAVTKEKYVLGPPSMAKIEWWVYYDPAAAKDSACLKWKQ